MKNRVKVDGLRELDAALGGMKKATARNVLRRVGIAALQPFDQAWRARAPRLTGDLVESGGVGTKLTKRQARLHRRQMFVEIFAGPNNPAAVQTEFGNAHQAPQPSVRPAWEQEGGPTLDRIAEGLGTEIDKVAAREARRAARLAAKMGR